MKGIILCGNLTMHIIVRILNGCWIELSSRTQLLPFLDYLISRYSTDSQTTTKKN